MTAGFFSTLVPALAILVPFVGTLLILISRRSAARWLCVAASAISLLFCLFSMKSCWMNGMEGVTTPLLHFGSVAVFGFTVDRVSSLLATAFVGIGMLVTVYATSYLDEGNKEHPDKHRKRFYAVFCAFIGAMAGVVFSSTILGQLVFFEITGACSWALIGYYNTPASQKAAMKALVITHLASLGLYCATAVLFMQTGTFDLAAIAQLEGGWKTAVVIGILIAAWGKSAQLPFYMWLPSAMNAPTPVSAYLHGASMVKVGVYIFARALLCSGPVDPVIGWIVVVGAIVTMVFAFSMYLPQKDIKRLLAFSTIAQLSYMFLGFGFAIFGSELALEGGIAHIFNHAFAKILFFLVAGALSYCMGTRMLTDIRGLWKKAPLIAVSFAIAALAIGGVPPFGPFFSKFAILAGGFETAVGNIPLMIIVVVAIIESICSFAWFLKWMGSTLPGEPSETVAEASPLPKAMAGVFIVLIVLIVCSGFVAVAWLN